MFSQILKQLEQDMYNSSTEDADQTLIQEHLRHCPPLYTGQRIYWYTQEDLAYARFCYGKTTPEDELEDYIEYSSGVLIPTPDSESFRVDARDCEPGMWILVIDTYPTDKCDPICEWISFSKFLVEKDLVKVCVQKD